MAHWTHLHNLKQRAKEITYSSLVFVKFHDNDENMLAGEHISITWREGDDETVDVNITSLPSGFVTQFDKAWKEEIEMAVTDFFLNRNETVNEINI